MCGGLHVCCIGDKNAHYMVHNILHINTPHYIFMCAFGIRHNTLIERRSKKYRGVKNSRMQLLAGTKVCIERSMRVVFSFLD